MYSDWKSVEILHQERISQHVKPVPEDEPEFSLWQRPQLRVVIRSITGWLARFRQRPMPRHADKRQDRRRAEWV